MFNVKQKRNEKPKNRKQKEKIQIFEANFIFGI